MRDYIDPEYAEQLMEATIKNWTSSDDEDEAAGEAVRALAGAFGGVLGSMCFSIVADVIPPHKRSTAMGYMGSGFSFASILGVPFSLFLAEKFDWHAPFIFLGVLLRNLFFN